jgi:hypothetical protein
MSVADFVTHQVLLRFAGPYWSGFGARELRHHRFGPGRRSNADPIAGAQPERGLFQVFQAPRAGAKGNSPHPQRHDRFPWAGGHG